MFKNRGYKNNDSKYISHFNVLGGRKYEYQGNYKNAMFKILDNFSEDKSETSDKSWKSTISKNDKREEEKKK